MNILINHYGINPEFIELKDNLKRIWKQLPKQIRRDNGTIEAFKNTIDNELTRKGFECMTNDGQLYDEILSL